MFEEEQGEGERAVGLKNRSVEKGERDGGSEGILSERREERNK